MGYKDNNILNWFVFLEVPIHYIYFHMFIMGKIFIMKIYYENKIYYEIFIMKIKFMIQVLKSI